MMRLPRFAYHAPRTIGEAAELLAEHGPRAMLLAGGTDLLPNMKRRQQVPQILIALRGIDALKRVRNGADLHLGAGLTLSQLVANPVVKSRYTGLWQAAVQVATPHLRNMGTLGGNICLDTRCAYYDQNHEWRKAIDFCMKKDGEICWVSTGSKKCLATSSTDTAPALISLGATVTLASTEGERRVPLRALYQDDGIDYLLRRPQELLVEVELDAAEGWSSTYWKLRRRGAFDFPILSAAAAAKLEEGALISAARIALGAVASQPVVCDEAAEFLIGKRLSDEVIEQAGRLAAKQARPVKNVDYTPSWRKQVIRQFVGYALKELRGDDTRALRRRIAQHELI